MSAAEGGELSGVTGRVHVQGLVVMIASLVARLSAGRPVTPRGPFRPLEVIATHLRRINNAGQFLR